MRVERRGEGMAIYPLYYCDANKNVNCKKTICKACNMGECECTTNKAFARTDENGTELICFNNEAEFEEWAKTCLS
jgi:hypothetical protein